MAKDRTKDLTAGWNLPTGPFLLRVLRCCQKYYHVRLDLSGAEAASERISDKAEAAALKGAARYLWLYRCTASDFEELRR